MKKKYIAGMLIILIISSGVYSIKDEQNVMNMTDPNIERYVALGDSYTSGEGVSIDERWPNMLVTRLKEEGIEVELVENQAVTGYTTQDIINHELSVFGNADPTFATLLIGANDLALEIDEITYRANLQTILDRMQAVLPQKNNIVLVTIPDFSKTPRGKQFGNDDELMRRIQEYNTILKDEGKRRDLVVVDIFSVSQNVEEDPSLIVPDGLHPSGKQYKMWMELIFPKAYDVIKADE